MISGSTSSCASAVPRGHSTCGHSLPREATTTVPSTNGVEADSLSKEATEISSPLMSTTARRCTTPRCTTRWARARRRVLIGG
ncbi:MAG: hypothetical protein K2F97_00075 [Muribaculaceae bacterium]|nr:hypothetical protein [Muribaculaceae bacterium]